MADVLCPVVVGRQAELAALEARLAQATEGRGGCVLLSGEPGIGKSRLVREVAAMAESRGAQVAVGRAVPTGMTAPYRPFTEMLHQALRGRPFPTDPDLVPWLPALAAIVPGAGEQVPGGDSSAAVRGEAVLQLLVRIATPAGMVVVLEDLHWADPDTVAVVEYLADNLSSVAVLFVVTVRSEPPSAALDLARRQRGRPGHLHLSLGRLDPGETASMILACDPAVSPDTVLRVQHAAEGVPLLVEEVLASPGVPTSLAETVRERLCEFLPEHRAVVEAAAVLGRHFDWRLLAQASGEGVQAVSDALERAVDVSILAVDDGSFRFRHALIREAVVELTLPPRRQALAAACLGAVESAHPRLEGSWLDLGSELAALAGDPYKAGTLLLASGRASLERGALATAADTLGRAAGLLEGTNDQIDAAALGVDALAMAGRMDEASALGAELISRLAEVPGSAAQRAEVHVQLAHAAVDASRWQAAAHHLRSARTLLGSDPPHALAARMSVLDAEIALAADDVEAARGMALAAIDAGAPGAEARCHAFEIIGRVERLRDLAAARDAFERALDTAAGADLPIWRLRALHELGTIDLFEHAGTERLVAARKSAEELGALSTAAVLDLQLSAGFHCHWSLDESGAHSHSALALADRLGVEQVRAKALCMLAENYAMAADRDGTERYITLTLASAAASGDPSLEGFCWGARGLATLLSGDPFGSLEPFTRATTILARLPHAEPAAFRALWPVLLASVGDARTAEAIGDARRSGVDSFHLNRGLLGFADAIVAGRTGDTAGADDLVRAAEPAFVRCERWADLARALAAGPAMDDGWGAPGEWIVQSAESFRAHGLGRMAEWVTGVVAGPRPHRWSALGITEREAEVLGLVAEGIPNKEIATRLRVSPRTVEKHVEALLRKTAARSRTQLAVMAAAQSDGHQSGEGEPRRPAR